MRGENNLNFTTDDIIVFSSNTNGHFIIIQYSYDFLGDTKILYS